MGFSLFGLEEKKVDRKTRAVHISKETMHRMQCEVCPLNEVSHTRTLKSPHMTATGSPDPLIYMLGEAPGETEDEKAEQFVGNSGQLLRPLIPERYEGVIRWNNVVRTRPPGNRDPTPTEIECCRPSVEADIEMSKPEAIFGFGAVPLHWAIDPGAKVRQIGRWSGRKIPMRIGSHTCWFFPFVHPSAILRAEAAAEAANKKDEGRFVFQLQLHNAFEAVDNLPDPEKAFLTEEDLRQDVEIITGERVDDAQYIVNFLRSLGSEKIAAFDYETNRERPYSEGAKILTAAFSSSERTLAFPLDHPAAKWYRPEDRDTVWGAVHDFLYTAPQACRKVAHNVAFELEWSGVFFGREVIHAGSWGDSLSQAYVLDERQGTHSLDMLMLQHCGVHLKDISGLDKTTLEFAPLEEVLSYNGLDSKSHRVLYVRQIKELKDAELMSTYLTHMKRVPTMVLTQMKGVPVHQPTVVKFKRRYEEELAQIEADIADLDEPKTFRRQTGRIFNPAADKDILHILHKIWGFHEYSNTDETVLSQIDHPLCELIIDHRGAAKNLSTYILPMLAGSPHLYPDGLLHPSVITTRTVTSRTSSASPNIQNYPKHDPVTRELRNQVQAIVGYKIVSFDWSGIQARNIAMESGDPFLINSFWNKYDVHKDWMERIIRRYPRWSEFTLKDKSEDAIKARKGLRQRAKNEFVFPSFFGAKANSVSASLGIPKECVYDLQEDLWGMFPGVLQWHVRLEKQYQAHGYVSGHSGYRRRAPAAYNERINAPIQADEAIIVCDAMSRLTALREEHYQPNLEIHDDLTFIWPKNKIDEYSEVVAREMTRISFPWINTPIEIEISIGDSWGEMEEVSKHSSVELWGHKR